MKSFLLIAYLALCLGASYMFMQLYAEYQIKLEEQAFEEEYNEEIGAAEYEYLTNLLTKNPKLAPAINKLFADGVISKGEFADIEEFYNKKIFSQRKKAFASLFATEEPTEY